MSVLFSTVLWPRLTSSSVVLMLLLIYCPHSFSAWWRNRFSIKKLHLSVCSYSFLHIAAYSFSLWTYSMININTHQFPSVCHFIRHSCFTVHKRAVSLHRPAPPTASYSPQVASIPLQTLQELHILVFIIIEKGPQIKNIQQIWVSACVSGHC